MAKSRKTPVPFYVAKDTKGQVIIASFDREDLNNFANVETHEAKEKTTIALAQKLLVIGGFHSRGGHARVSATTPEQRSKWARKAAMARHHPKPEATLAES